MKRIFVFFLFINSLFFRSQTNLQLSYEGYLENVLLNNPLAKRADNEKKYASALYKAARGNYDPMINGSYENKFLNGKNYYSSLNSEIKQPIFTSQYLKFGYDYGAGTFINPELNTSSFVDELNKSSVNIPKEILPLKYCPPAPPNVKLEFVQEGTDRLPLLVNPLSQFSTAVDVIVADWKK